MILLMTLIVFFSLSVSANTEKTIVVGPSYSKNPHFQSNLDELSINLDALSPVEWSLRTQVGAAFPTQLSSNGKSSWILLHGLVEGQKYEVRVCWTATQPTLFHLETFELSYVFETPHLATSIRRFIAKMRQKLPESALRTAQKRRPIDYGSSAVLIRIFAAAEYFTVNDTIMNNVPPVNIEIILDAYHLNLFPRSLVSTTAYLIVLVTISFMLSPHIEFWIHVLLRLENEDFKED